ncbi:hypothetical protein SDJN03_07007, partial [Cucurbita argyrosperma subsp. sororia]
MDDAVKEKEEANHLCLAPFFEVTSSVNKNQSLLYSIANLWPRTRVWERREIRRRRGRRGGGPSSTPPGKEAKGGRRAQVRGAGGARSGSRAQRPRGDRERTKRGRQGSLGRREAALGPLARGAGDGKRERTTAEKTDTAQQRRKQRPRARGVAGTGTSRQGQGREGGGERDPDRPGDPERPARNGEIRPQRPKEKVPRETRAARDRRTQERRATAQESPRGKSKAEKHKHAGGARPPTADPGHGGGRVGEPGSKPWRTHKSQMTEGRRGSETGIPRRTLGGKQQRTATGQRHRACETQREKHGPEQRESRRKKGLKGGKAESNSRQRDVSRTGNGGSHTQPHAGQAQGANTTVAIRTVRPRGVAKRRERGH